ncbi:hypothetical protein L3Q82_012169, partial [Scortum barcoo]
MTVKVEDFFPDLKLLVDSIRFFLKNTGEPGQPGFTDQEVYRQKKLVLKVSADASTQLEADISPQELWEALQSLKPGKAPGLDGLPAHFYKAFCCSHVVASPVLCGPPVILLAKLQAVIVNCFFFFTECPLSSQRGRGKERLQSLNSLCWILKEPIIYGTCFNVSQTLGVSGVEKYVAANLTTLGQVVDLCGPHMEDAAALSSAVGVSS